MTEPLRGSKLAPGADPLPEGPTDPPATPRMAGAPAWRMQWSPEPAADSAAAGLTAEQEIRAHALAAAAATFEGALLDEADEIAAAVLEIAEQYAAYITTGTHPPDTDIPEQP